MSSLKLKDNIYWVGVANPELRVFDIIMETKKGTTYNSYLIKDDKIAVIDTVKDGYFEEFLGNIKNEIGDREVDYIIVQHTELDHSGSLKYLIEQYKDATVISSKAAGVYLKQILNKDFKWKDIQEFSGGLSLGHNTLKFISAPNLHWPDTMFTYVKEQKVLFTCDFLGCHYCPHNCVTDDCSEDYFDEMKYYFDVIMGPFKKFARMGLDKIKDLDFDMVMPSHGPIHINDVQKYLDLYKEWSNEQAASEKNVQIFYVSAYGNTEKVAIFLKDYINEKGIHAEARDITSLTLQESASLIEKASGIMIGSPTINQDAVKPVWDLLSLVCPITNRGKASAAFGSYGWSGEAIPMMTERLKSLKFKVIEEGLKINFVPDNSDFANAKKIADKLIDMINA